MKIEWTVPLTLYTVIYIFDFLTLIAGHARMAIHNYLYLSFSIDNNIMEPGKCGGKVSKKCHHFSI